MSYAPEFTIIVKCDRCKNAQVIDSKTVYGKSLNYYNVSHGLHDIVERFTDFGRDSESGKVLCPKCFIALTNFREEQKLETAGFFKMVEVNR